MGLLIGGLVVFIVFLILVSLGIFVWIGAYCLCCLVTVNSAGNCTVMPVGMCFVCVCFDWIFLLGFRTFGV